MFRPVEFDYLKWWRDVLRHVSCDGAEVHEIEMVIADQKLGSLPSSYESFLIVAGRRCGPLWVGSDAFVPELIGLRSAALDLVDECGADALIGDDDVVIAMHQGYEVLYLSGGSADPPVLRFTEGDAVSTKIAQHFSEFVLKALKEA